MNVILFSGTSKPDSIHLNYAQFSQDINQLILKAKAGQTEMPVYSTLDYSTSENITIGGRSGIKYSDSTGNVGVYFLGDKYGFLFYSGITNGEEINQILATFRFD